MTQTIEPVIKAVIAAFQWGNSRSAHDETTTDILLDQAVKVAPSPWAPVIWDLCSIAYDCGKAKSYHILTARTSALLNRTELDKPTRRQFRKQLSGARSHLESE